MTATIAVVGASLAGLSAARALRDQSYDGRIVVIGDEVHAPYDRPPLSKEFLAGFWIVNVDSAERAYEIAAKASAAPGPGGVPLNMPIEVRQVGSAPPVDA